MPFDHILRAYAFGLIHPDKMREMMRDMPALREWLVKESRRMRAMIEHGVAVPTQRTFVQSI